MIIVGKRIRNARVLAGLTQEQLAERIGVSRTAIVRWEGGSEFTLEHLLALTKALNVSADYLLGIESNIQMMDVLMDISAKINQLVEEKQEEQKK